MRVFIPKHAWYKSVPRDWPWWHVWKRDQLELVEDWWIQIDGEWWCIKKGTRWDGSTIPRLLWVIAPPTYGPAIHGSLFHDECYRRWWRRVTKPWSDEALRAIMLYDGAEPFMARAFWLGVRANVTGGGW